MVLHCAFLSPQGGLGLFVQLMPILILIIVSALSQMMVSSPPYSLSQRPLVPLALSLSSGVGAGELGALLLLVFLCFISSCSCSLMSHSSGKAELFPGRSWGGRGSLA